MIGVTIRDTDERNGHRFLNFDVATILSLIEDKLRDSVWKCSELDCLGENAKTIHDIADQKRVISGNELLQIMSGVYQTIDGKFEGYMNDEYLPFLMIEAIDSSHFNVWCEDSGVIDKLTGHFEKTSRIASNL
jgi:hypothetical protein